MSHRKKGIFFRHAPPVFSRLSEEFLRKIEITDVITSFRMERNKNARDIAEKRVPLVTALNNPHLTHGAEINIAHANHNGDSKAADGDMNVNVKENGMGNGSVLKPNQRNQKDSTQINNHHQEEEEEEERNGTWFLVELNITCDRIRKNVDEVEGYIETDSETIPEEVLGKLRSSIGKANLLLKQKLNQFRDLCLKNINKHEGEEFATTNEDLEGFWEMVMIQIHEIDDTFEEITRLKRNDWKEEPVKVNKPKLTSSNWTGKSPLRGRNVPKSTQSPNKSCNGNPPSSATSSPSKSAINRDQLRRDRLREAKRRQAEKLQADADQITIFMPSRMDVNGDQIN